MSKHNVASAPAAPASPAETPAVVALDTPPVGAPEPTAEDGARVLSAEDACALARETTDALTSAPWTVAEVKSHAARAAAKARAKRFASWLK